jgi:hypothetical protein
MLCRTSTQTSTGTERHVNRDLITLALSTHLMCLHDRRREALEGVSGRYDEDKSCGSTSWYRVVRAIQHTSQRRETMQHITTQWLRVMCVAHGCNYRMSKDEADDTFHTRSAPNKHIRTASSTGSAEASTKFPDMSSMAISATFGFQCWRFCSRQVMRSGDDTTIAAHASQRNLLGKETGRKSENEKLHSNVVMEVLEVHATASF